MAGIEPTLIQLQYYNLEGCSDTPANLSSKTSSRRVWEFFKLFLSSKAKKNLTREQIEAAFKDSYTISEVCKKLELQPKGANHYSVKNYMSKYGFNLKPIDKSNDESPVKIIREKKSNKYKRKYATNEEARKAITKGNYPSDEEMLEMVWKISVFKLAKSIGVTDNGVRHYCQKRNIPTPPPGYWRKLETGKIDDCKRIKEESFLNWEGLKKVTPFPEKKENAPEFESGLDSFSSAL